MAQHTSPLTRAALRAHDEAIAHTSMIGIIRMLLVEDDPVQTELLRTQIEAANTKHAGAASFELDCVGTSAACLDIVTEKGFDLVLLDLVLPDQPGCECRHPFRATASECECHTPGLSSHDLSLRVPHR